MKKSNRSINNFIPGMSLLTLLTLVAAPLSAETFRFKYTQGNAYRILSTVQEDVFVDNQPHHHADLVNRAQVNITATQDNKGRLEATFMTTENAVLTGGDATASQKTLTWGKEYTSIFTRDEYGKYTISDAYFMPTVRNVPIFPPRDLKAGDTWTASGEEAHDLRGFFNITTPFRMPFTAQYTYVGPETQKNGKTLYIILVKYTIAFDLPKGNAAKNSPVQGAVDYPARMEGYSNQTLYWDNDKGELDHYSEDFKTTLITVSGVVFDFIGTAQAEVLETETVSGTQNVESVKERITEMGLADVAVRADEKGLTITLEDIKFEADSAVLLDSEKQKLQKIAEILNAYPDNDILVSGHTALAGTAGMRQKLSEERAASVAAYMVELGVRDAYHVFTRGFGADKPIAPNTTDAGKARNRRVEITLMDK